MLFRGYGAQCCFFLLGLVLTIQASAADIAEGEYLARIGGCIFCHTEDAARPLSGGRAIATPFGVLYTPNISPDPETGIGKWSFSQFAEAMRNGRAPDGHRYYPAFPYTSFTRINDADLQSLFAWLSRQSAFVQVSRASELVWPMSQRALLMGWQSFYFDPGQYQYDEQRSPAWNRGAYLVQGVSHCAECHTSRDILGGLIKRRFMAGARLPSAHWAPNLTPHVEGLQAWSDSDIAQYLLDGHSEYTRKARDEMREVIDNETRFMSDEDRLAIASYLMTLAAQPTRAPLRKSWK